MQSGWLWFLLLCLSGCSSIAREEASYPSDWALLSPPPRTGCGPPAGIFENTHWQEHFEYPETSGYRHPAPKLSSVLGVNSVTARVTHLKLQPSGEGNLLVEAFGVEDGKEKTLSSRVVPASESRCQDNRWFISSSTTHEGFSGYAQEDFDALYSAMYLVGTFGLGAPISSWWNYVLSVSTDGSLVLRRQNMDSGLFLIVFYSRVAMNDDWFLYRATNSQTVIAAAESQRGILHPVSASVAQESQRLPEDDACLVNPQPSPLALLRTGETFYRARAYPQAMACFTASAEHPSDGNREAMWYLCTMHELGYGVEKSLEAAKRWCGRASQSLH